MALTRRLPGWLLMLAVVGCDHGSEPTPPAEDGLTLVRTVAVDVPEPSDLCLDRDGIHAWTVSDQTGRVYRLRLTDGAVVTTLAFVGDDPEESGRTQLTAACSWRRRGSGRSCIWTRRATNWGECPWRGWEGTPTAVSKA